jgi:hypothetical protein
LVVVSSEQQHQIVFGSLEAVGRPKPLGYQPLNTVEKHLAMNIGEVIVRLAKRGLKTKVFSAKDCCIYSGALYAYDRSALQKVLDGMSALLVRSNWPTNAEQFVDRVSKDWVESSHPVYAVIQMAFGDAR